MTPHQRRAQIHIIVDNTRARPGDAVAALLAIPACCVLSGLAWWAWVVRA